MRELRKDVDSGLESTKEEIDNMDEMKIEDVLMGLKGLKQEEVFSFLGKNNFTPAETEEWLKMMSSTGFSGFDHLSTVDAVEIEQLQLSLSAHFDGNQGSIGHVFASKTDLKSKIKNEPKPTIVSEIPPKTQSVVSEWSTEDSHYQRVSSSWPNEEEIIATSIGEELICTSNPDEEDDYKYLPNNTYMIQSSIDQVEVPDKPKPIKLFIKRVESEDEVPACPDSDSSVTRTKSKRVWNPSAKLETQEPAVKKKKCTRRSSPKTKVKVASTLMKKEPDSYDELDFSFPNTVHQDDEFVYPSLDMSDDEEDVYSFSQRDDETWTPKIKMKINEEKPQRPTRNRKQNSAVAKFLEAAAMKRAGPMCNKPTKKSRKFSSNVRNTSYPSTNVSQDCVAEYPFNVPTCSQSLLHSLPSTSSAIILESSTPSLLPPCYPPVSDEFTVQSSPSTSSSFSSPSTSESLSPHVPARRGRKAKPKPSPKVHKLHLKADFKGSRLIPPKNCKLLQTTRSAVVATLHPGRPAKQHIKSDGNQTPSTSSPSNAEKKVPSCHVTKRGKPKKGMATAKQRLGKILKMHKMFY